MWILVLLVGFMLDTGTAPAAEHVRARGVWVTRWDFKNAGDVARIFKNVKELGATQVFFQVRGNATVCYPSRIEPWAWELTGITPATLGKDPGWDPLAVAVEEAAKNHVELHAWMNVFPGWRGVEPVPKGFKHPWADKRSWFMVDHRGVLMRPTATFYTFMSPGSPAVREYLTSVFGEIAQLYPTLDGIHLDYVRYPGHKELGGFRDFSYDEASVAAFQKLYKRKRPRTWTNGGPSSASRSPKPSAPSATRSGWLPPSCGCPPPASPRSTPPRPKKGRIRASGCGKTWWIG